MTDVLTNQPTTIVHPLAPLDAGELRLAAGAALAAAGDGAWIVGAALREPDKGRYLAWRGRPDATPRPPREARVAVADAAGVSELTVELPTGAVTGRDRVPGAQPPMIFKEYDRAAEAVVADERVQRALAARGVTDMSLVQVDVLPSGVFGHHLEATHRFGRAVCYARRDRGGNGYARPVEHLIVYVDLDTLRVLEVEDGEHRPIPEGDGDYRAGVVPPRTDLTPIVIAQPDGVSFSVEGGVVRWQRWSMVLGVDPQEGLVLHDVRYDERPVLHRASCAEMIVPYGEPDPMHNWRTFFDAGEYGLGACLNSLELGCDCLGEIVYLDAHLADDSGGVRTIANAICVHEEDAGLLWKHTDDRTGGVESRRGRRLVVNAMATVGNYEYAFRWYFGLDGTIEVEIQLHGIVSTMVPGGGPPHGSNIVDDGLAAPHHQHLFCFRLDLDVDGTVNRVREVESDPVPVGPDNPVGNAFRPRTTELRSELAARRDANDGRSRSWIVQSAKRRNGHGSPTAYRLVPGHGTATLLAQPGSSADRRAGFARHTLWVTPHDPAQRHPAGTYPYGRIAADGLPHWTEADRPLEDADLVLWYTVGVTHFVRPEDWPIMPVNKAGFTLQPVGFFDRNPTLDLPPPSHCSP
ncbi:MAG TPA: primary-amine oxidase [Solirubrobacteraceae bacterium]|nr:primary-amine oxidase [Solirubrobacteraceae bacterium]